MKQEEFPVKGMWIGGTEITAYRIVYEAEPTLRKAAETLAEMVFRAVGCRLETVTEEDAGVYS